MGVDDYKDGFSFKILPHRLEELLRKKTPHHIYKILTKRDKIMLGYFKDKEILDNIWLGVSVENAAFKKRIDSLRKVKAKIRFISFEPWKNLE